MNDQEELWIDAFLEYFESEKVRRENEKFITARNDFAKGVVKGVIEEMRWLWTDKKTKSTTVHIHG